ncbi:MAG: hypothetical protein KC422_04765 [Trueperaceae bacterium]|nr:hypothetical protein [Trueperaceae bacterium]
MRTVILTVGLVLLAFASAQPLIVGENYAPSTQMGGTIRESSFGDINTLNPYLTGSATESAVLGMYGGPGTVYRDWLGTRSFRNAEGGFNLYWAKEIEEVRPEQEFIVTLKEGWKWSDGVEMTADDAIAAFIIHGDPEVESNGFSCSVVGDEQVEYEKLGTYQYRFSLPKPQVNAIFANDCVNAAGAVPAHIFMPIYEAQGAEGIKALWGVDTDPSTIISGGPYLLTEFRPGERVVLERNPTFGEFVQDASGNPLPGADEWIVTLTADQNAELALVVTGQVDFYWPTVLDQVRAVQEAVNNGSIGGNFYPNLSPSTSTDFITYNFNSTDTCKSGMFRNQLFRQAMSLMIDRDALVQAALGGLGFPAIAQTTQAIAPFVPDLPEFEYNPDAGVALLKDIGFTEMASDGVLTNPETGCRAEFDLQFNSGNNRRGQQALVISQMTADYGVKINPREVSTEIWQNSILGTEMPRMVDYDAQIWGLSGGDIDNPSSNNVLRIASNLNSWNKNKDSVEAWEILMDKLTTQMDETLDTGARVDLFKQRAEIMREYLPLTPLIAQSFHFYENVGNDWPKEALDAVSIQSPYNPGNRRENLTVAP